MQIYMIFSRLGRKTHTAVVALQHQNICYVSTSMTKLRKLGDSPLFRLALFMPLISGVSLLAITVLSNENSNFCMTSECINNFFDLYKYPLSIMGLSVPLTAIVAALHRSEEAHQQIEETLKQNTFNNYIKHKEEFLKLLEKIEKQCSCQFTDPLFLYNRIFPKNNYSSFSFEANSVPHPGGAASNDFLEELRRCPAQAAFTLRSPDTDEETLIRMLLELYDAITMLRIKPAIENVIERTDSKLIWPENYIKNAQSNLRIISRHLTSFSFYAYKVKIDNTQYHQDSRRHDTHDIYKRNMAIALRLTAEMEKNLLSDSA